MTVAAEVMTGGKLRIPVIFHPSPRNEERNGFLLDDLSAGVQHEVQAVQSRCEAGGQR